MKKEIGGFLEVKLQEKKEYHNNSIRFNLARHAINFLIKKKDIKKFIYQNTSLILYITL